MNIVDDHRDDYRYDGDGRQYHETCARSPSDRFVEDDGEDSGGDDGREAVNHCH